MQNFKLFFLVTVTVGVFIFFVFNTQVFAQSASSETYSLEKGDFSTGGFVTGTSETFTSGSTFGEPLVGVGSGGTYQSGSGFQESGGADSESGGGGSSGNSSSGGRRIFYNANVILENIAVFFEEVTNNILNNFKPAVKVDTVTTTPDEGIKYTTPSDDYTFNYTSHTPSDINKNAPPAFSIKDILAIVGLLLVLTFIFFRFRNRKQNNL